MGLISVLIGVLVIVVVGALVGLTQGRRILNAFGFWTQVP